MRKHKRLIAIMLAGLYLINSINVSAAPNAYQYETEEGPLVHVDINKEETVEDENPTGIEHGENGETTLKQDITMLTPLLKEALRKVYNKTINKLKEKIRGNKWDLDYTMQSFYDIEDPYKDMDYNKLIAAYSTVVEMGRNNRPLLSDCPLIKLDTKEVESEDGIKYALVTVKILDEKGILKYYGYDPEDEVVKKKYEYRLKAINKALREDVLKKNLFVTPITRTARIDDETLKNLQNYTIPEDLDEETQKLIVIAMSLVGQIPYDWGGKASHDGWNEIWNTWNESNGRMNGLDCSGFVSWAYLSAGYDKNVFNGLYSTYSIRESLQDISAEELRPGDIGLLKNNSVGTNHTGIYLGNGLWIHCASSKGGVCINNGCFRFFKRAPEGIIDEDVLEENYEEALARLDNLKSTSENGTLQPADGSDGIATSEEDIYTFAQLIEHEVGGEPYDAWVAVAEVVLNRANYPSYFPDNIVDVIYQKGQFSYVHEIKDIVPRQEVIDVAREVAAGRLKYFNNNRVIFFKNPTITNGIPATDPVDWGSHPWYMAVGATAFYLDNA